MDLHRYLVDEPVLASPPSAGYQLRKFVRKNRGPVLAASIIAVLLLVGTITTSLGFARAERLRQVAERNEKEALDEKTRAQALQQQAMDALRATTDDVIKQLIGAKPVLGPAEKAFLQAALKRWQKFADQRGDDMGARTIRVEGSDRIALIRMQLGQNEEACSDFRQVIRQTESLALEYPDELWFRGKCAAAYTNLGRLLAESGKNADAEDAYLRALAIKKKLAEQYPDVHEHRMNLATSYNNLAALYADLWRRLEAEAALRTAVDILEQLVADVPGVPEYREGLARSRGNLGVVLMNMGKHEEAEAADRQALTVCRELVHEFPDMVDYRKGLGLACSQLGSVFAIMRKGLKAETAHQEALVIRQKLADEFPSIPEFRNDLGFTLCNLGGLLHQAGRRSEAEAAYHRGLSVLGELVDEFPIVPAYRQKLAETQNGLAAMLMDEIQKLPEANTLLRKSVAIREKLASDFPNTPRYRVDLAGSLVNLGIIQSEDHKPEDALELYTRAIETLEGVLRDVKSDAMAQHFYRNAHWNRAIALDDLKRHAEAAKDWDRTVQLSPESEQSRFRIDCALSRVRAGLADLAVHDIEETARNANVGIIYDAACVCALAANCTEKSAGSLWKEDCCKRAVALLRQAIAKGYKDAEHVKTDDDLKALREREDFKKLVAELEAAKESETKSKR
jgi:tetratricopeptide (TPR) repeat protein